MLSRRVRRYTDRVPLFWLNYRNPAGRPAGVVIIEAPFILQARMKAAVSGIDQGLEFVNGHELDAASSRQIPENMVGKLLNDGDLRKLHRMLLTKKPPPPAVRRRTTVKKAARR